jgi:hypothetical protein
VVPEAAGVSADAAAAITGDDSGQGDQDGSGGSQRALPATQGEAAPQDGGDVPDGLTAAAELLVFDALQRAGGRLLTPQTRGQFKSTPRHELHTVIASADPGALLEGSFAFVERVAVSFAVSPRALEGLLTAYTRGLVARGQRHDRDALRAVLRELW